MKNIAIDEARLAEYCRTRRIVRLSLFGSVLREDFSAASDVDVLVRFADDAEVSLFDFVTVADELTNIFGRRVDLGLEAELIENGDPAVRDAILSAAVEVYVARSKSSAIWPVAGTWPRHLNIDCNGTQASVWDCNRLPISSTLFGRLRRRDATPAIRQICRTTSRKWTNLPNKPLPYLFMYMKGRKTEGARVHVRRHGIRCCSRLPATENR